VLYAALPISDLLREAGAGKCDQGANYVDHLFLNVFLEGSFKQPYSDLV